MATALDGFLDSAADSIVATDWSGRGKDRAVAAMTALVLQGREIRDALNQRATDLDNAATTVEKLRTADIVSIILSLVLAVLTFGLGAALSPLVVALGVAIRGVLTRVVSIAI